MAKLTLTICCTAARAPQPSLLSACWLHGAGNGYSKARHRAQASSCMQLLVQHSAVLQQMPACAFCRLWDQYKCALQVQLHFVLMLMC